MDRARYREAIRVCCLEKDMEVMDYGDQTEIGERGINLSGGKKQRIQLARAVYQDRDIYLLDDVFSAVDAHTGSDIFKECLRGVLKQKTILLVTHQIDFLYNVELILVMRDGMIVQSGKYKDVVDTGMDFKALVSAHETSMELVEMGKAMLSENSAKPKSPRANGDNKSLDEPKPGKGSSKLIKDEDRETGKVSFQVYKMYCTEAYGWCGVTVVLQFYLSWQASIMAADYWLAYQTSEARAMISWAFSFYSCIWHYSCCVIRAVLIRSLCYNIGTQDSTKFLHTNASQHLACSHVILQYHAFRTRTSSEPSKNLKTPF